jgi:hypothetical protein
MARAWFSRGTSLGKVVGLDAGKVRESMFLTRGLGLWVDTLMVQLSLVLEWVVETGHFGVDELYTLWLHKRRR